MVIELTCGDADRRPHRREVRVAFDDVAVSNLCTPQAGPLINAHGGIAEARAQRDVWSGNGARGL